MRLLPREQSDNHRPEKGVDDRPRIDSGEMIVEPWDIALHCEVNCRADEERCCHLEEDAEQMTNKKPDVLTVVRSCHFYAEGFASFAPLRGDSEGGARGNSK